MNKIRKYAIRKLAVGAVSACIGISTFGTSEALATSASNEATKSLEINQN